MLKIFVEQISERLIYTLDFVFRERGLSYQLVNDPVLFMQSEGLGLNLSERQLPNVTQFVPASILFDEEIIIYDIHSSQFEDEDCLKFNGVSDPLSSIFFVLSRMEEYTSTIEDEHGRFPAKASVLNRYGWMQKAMCDRWAISFLKFLKKHHLVEYVNRKNEPLIIPTFDIDNVYAYQLKEGIRSWLSAARDYIKGDKIRINERRQVVQGARVDPYDTYDYILSIAERGYAVHMFWLLGDYAQYDKNVTFRDARHQRLIRKMSLKTEVGIHPSYRSGGFEYHLRNEKERLEQILNAPVHYSRQHFLRLKVGQTYRVLESIGIRHDFTMGYAETIGFRAGTARPFKWFDLQKNRVSNLLIHPFVYMDGTLNEYMKVKPGKACELIDQLFDEVVHCGGQFVFIWHNETIGEYGKWNGWRKVLEHTLQLRK
jgi:hypothetical protein